MTSYHLVWSLVLLITVAAKNDTSTWNPWCKTGADCTCEVVGGLNSVSCTHKRISRTPIFGFPFPGGTQVADLSNNELHLLRDYAFNQYHKGGDQGLGILLTLNFSRNSIQRIGVNAFKFVDNLTILDVSYNKIDKLTPKTFENMGKLRELYLQHNAIRTLEEFTFQGLNGLKILDLSYCLISKISWWAFYFSNSPKLLNLQNNILTTFHSNYVFSPASLRFSEGINLLNNPIICDCDLERFYIDTITVVGKYNLTCFAPESVRNYHMTALMDEDFRGCTSGSMIEHFDRIVEGFASNTTTLSCKTIPGPLFKNWTITSKVDGQNITLWPERFKLSQSPTWVNLTISDTQKSDEGNYTCTVSERMYGSVRYTTATVMLVVKELDLSPMIMKEKEGRGQSKNGTTGMVETPQGDEPTLWLVLTITGVLILFVVMVMIIVMRMGSRRGEMVAENIYEPCDRTSHMYEDVDQVLSRLAQRSLPRLPSQHYATVQPQSQPQPQSHYLQHCMKMQLLFTPESSVSSMSTNDLSDYCSKGPYDNELYLRPRPSESPIQGDNFAKNNLKYIAALPTYSQLPTGPVAYPGIH